VAFFVDGVQFDQATVAPWSTRWRITGRGAHTFLARAYDAAGNFTDSAPVTITVR